MRVLSSAMIAAMVVIAGPAGLVSAALYNDTTGEVFDAGFTHMDIESVEITNDATWLYINVNTAGDLDATNWGKYAIAIDNGGAGDAGNGWGRNIDWDGRTITHWSATWADDGGSGAGGEVYEFSGGWNLLGATYNGSPNIAASDAGHAAGTQTWQLLLSDLGVGIGGTIDFDVVSTGGSGTDPGVDHLSRADMATPGWGDQSTAGTFLSYTIVAPEPASVMLTLSALGLVAARRRRM